MPDNLTIDLQGAQTLLKFLTRVQKGDPPDNAGLEAALAANKFFVDFYSRWEGINREKIAETFRRFAQPDWIPAERLLASLVGGFRRAVNQPDVMQARLDFLATVDPSAISDRALPYLPPDTPLESVVHITIDAFNGAFVHGREMGISLLEDITDREWLESMVAHELHHVGFRYWAERDTVRQALLKGQTGRAIALQHVQNLLFEGLANYYCTPRMVFGDSPDPSAQDPIEARLGKLHRDESQLFARAEEILSMSLSPDADFEQCKEAFLALALDMEEGILPAAHYLGARMVETMNRHHPLDKIIGCVKDLPSFLSLYNQAAQASGAFTFDIRLVDQFAQMWE